MTTYIDNRGDRKRLLISPPKPSLDSQIECLVPHRTDGGRSELCDPDLLDEPSLMPVHHVVAGVFLPVPRDYGHVTGDVGKYLVVLEL